MCLMQQSKHLYHLWSFLLLELLKMYCMHIWMLDLLFHFDVLRLPFRVHEKY